MRLAACGPPALRRTSRCAQRCGPRAEERGGRPEIRVSDYKLRFTSSLRRGEGSGPARSPLRFRARASSPSQALPFSLGTRGSYALFERVPRNTRQFFVRFSHYSAPMMGVLSRLPRLTHATRPLFHFGRRSWRVKRVNSPLRRATGAKQLLAVPFRAVAVVAA